MLSNNAKKVYEVIKAAGGGVIDEYKILNRADMSHGSFSAARKELIDAGMLSLDKDGRKTVYIVNADTSNDTSKSDVKSADTPPADKPPAPPPRSSARPPVRRQPKALASVSVNKMPRVTGEFTDIDEWEDALISRIGGCVDISQIDDTHYEVTAYDLDETARYTVIDDGESITVS